MNIKKKILNIEESLSQKNDESQNSQSISSIQSRPKIGNRIFKYDIISNEFKDEEEKQKNYLVTKIEDFQVINSNENLYNKKKSINLKLMKNESINILNDEIKNKKNKFENEKINIEKNNDILLKGIKNDIILNEKFKIKKENKKFNEVELKISPIQENINIEKYVNKDDIKTFKKYTPNNIQIEKKSFQILAEIDNEQLNKIENEKNVNKNIISEKVNNDNKEKIKKKSMKKKEKEKEEENEDEINI